MHRAIFQNLDSSPRRRWIFFTLTVTYLTNPSKSFKGFAQLSKLIIPTNSSFLGHHHLKNQHVGQAKAFSENIGSMGVYQSTKMIAVLVENHKLDEALELFDKMPVKDVVAWNLMLKGCLRCGEVDMSMNLFDEMPQRNVITWTTLVNGLLRHGRVEEAEKLFWGMPVRDIAAWNAMIYGYFENGRVKDAMKLFAMIPSRNVISWTCMISGLDQHGRSDEARLIFVEMVRFGVVPTSCCLSSVITACAKALDLSLGIQIHGHILKLGGLFDAYVSSSLITFYANCKQMKDSCKVFNERLHMEVAVWTSLMTGYGSNNKHEEALSVMRAMFRNGILPNQSSFTSALNSCCEMEVIDAGKEIHGAAIKLGVGTDAFVGNSLVVLYFKCGSLSNGIDIFKEITYKNIVSWNSVIVGCAQHGYGMWTLALFRQMLRTGTQPDDITFTGLLSACNHSGLLEKGRHIFKYLEENETMEVKLEHYACMLDTLCRCGEVEEAEILITNMPMKANLSMWLCLLNGCRKHSNFDVAERVAKNTLSVDPQCSSAHILLSNMYALAGRWNDVSRIRLQMRKSGTIKPPGISWVTQKGVRHEFVSGSRSHPLSSKIYQKLEWLGKKLKEFGYIPDQRFALHDVEDEQKEAALSSHCERLAISFALISNPGSVSITVMKNLRVCEDCHSAIKLIAKIVNREIVLRDASRFHHFRDGFCTCKDYW